MSTTIPAEVHSDDYAAEARFDATPWFEQASDQEILDLAGCEWGGDYPADAVARFFEQRDSGVDRVFTYLSFQPPMSYTSDAVGFECHVDALAALDWLRVHRPSVAARLAASARRVTE